MHLRDAEIVCSLAARHLGPDRRADCVRGAQKIRVDTNTRAHTSSLDPAATAEMQRHAVVRVSRNHQHRRNNLAAMQFELDGLVLLDAKLAHRLEAHQRRVVPRQVRHLLGQLLQPADVGVAPVIERRIGQEPDLERPIGRRRRECQQRGALRSGNVAAVDAVPSTQPSCSAFLHALAKSPLM